MMTNQLIRLYQILYNKMWLKIHYIMIILSLYPNMYPHYIFKQLFTVGISGLCMQNLIFPYLALHTNIENIIGTVRRPNSLEGGMPSGHCQVYWTVTTYLLKHNEHMIFNMFLIYTGCILIHSRIVTEKKHTPNQVLIGTLIGCLIGYYYLP